MWMPNNEEEILAVLAAGGLHETASFEAKRQLPDKTRNIDVAIDVAAMSTDGGVIIYGLDEDENHFVTTISPIPLAGVRERISSIIQTSISEVPAFSIKPIQSNQDPALGYVIVIVPPSTRAPHLVSVRDNNRFYGRTDTGNRLLNEAEIARLYQRRASAETDFTQQLRHEAETAPIPLDNQRGHFFLFAQPVLPNRNFIDDATATPVVRDLLNSIVGSAIALPIRQDWAPTITYIGNWRRSLDGFRSDDRGSRPSLKIDMQFDFSGSIHLFCGRGADSLENGTKVVFSSLLAGLTMQFVFMTGKFCESAGYLGNVKFGILLTGIQGTVLYSAIQSWHGMGVEPFMSNEYIRTTSVSALSITQDYQAIASALVMPLVAVMSKEQDDPFRVLLRR